MHAGDALQWLAKFTPELRGASDRKAATAPIIAGNGLAQA
jgi:hypothetical protein